MKRSLRVPHLMLMLTALAILIPSAHEAFLNGQAVSAKAKTLSPSEPLPPQGRTIEIDIKDKQYTPPNRTPKIPPGLKEQGVRFAVHAGDTIRICNTDNLKMMPFSTSKGNSFGGFTGRDALLPGECMHYVVQNPTGDATFKLFDEIHARNKLFLVVLPANSPDEGEENTPPGRKFNDPTAEYNINDKGDIYSDDPEDVQPPTVETLPEDTVKKVPKAGNTNPPATNNKRDRTPVLGTTSGAMPKYLPCSRDEYAAFVKMEGSWKSYRMNITIGGSCEKMTGTYKVADWCEGVDAKDNPTSVRTTVNIDGKMESGTLQVNYAYPAHGKFPAGKGTGSCELMSDGTLSCSGFGCSSDRLKR